MIYIFGHPPSNAPGEFPNRAAAVYYLQHELAEVNHFRYHYYQKVNAVDRILFSFEGFLLGVLFVHQVVDPTPADIVCFAKTKGTYVISEIREFCNQDHKAIEFDIKNYQFGKRVNEEDYREILRVCGGFCGTTLNPEFTQHT